MVTLQHGPDVARVPDQGARPPDEPPPVTEPGDGGARPPRFDLTSRLRQLGYAAVLIAFAFSQSSGQMVADTKFDLVTNPRGFLGASLRLWDPSAAFGQIQNQAYGYAWPMGPVFLLGELARVPEWAVQRLWWALLLCVAFFGILRLSQRLRIGTPATQVLAAFAFVLTPRITTLLGGTSVEIWPMALAPWVLLPLVIGSERGSVRRYAALSALAVATCGGVNAVAVAAVLPLGVVWLLTRGPGARKWRLLGWWTGFTMLATLWWSAPLLLLGRYSVPFLDYIENSTVTTVPTDLARSLVGESDWVAYFAGIDYPAGQQLVSTPFLMMDAAAVVALGLAGIALRDNRHQRFLTWGVLVGVMLVGFGYAGDLAGFFAADRSAWLDGALAPLRNLHKFDVVLRIPLVLGLAHVMAALPALLSNPETPRSSRASIFAVRSMALLALVALALPWFQDRIAPRNGIDEVPAYWSAAADYLARSDDGTVALEVPATAFGVYSWGNTHDDVLQGLATSPWAVRNVIPLAQPGNVVALDAVTRTLESGRPSRALAPFLAANGVGRLVVRNDLDRFQTGAPDPAYVRAVLDESPGITLERSFGPTVGTAPSVVTAEGDVRVISGNGLSVETGSVDVYTVDGAATGRLTSDPKVVVGDPASGLRSDVDSLGAADAPLSEDAAGSESGQILTDGTRRRETNFAAVRWNESATMGAAESYRLPGPEQTHRFLDDQDRWQTTEVWAGQVTDVRASSSQSYADGLAPLQIGSHPGAALDRDPQTAWRSAAQVDPTGQFWQADFLTPLTLTSVSVTLSRDSAAVPELELALGNAEQVVPAPAPGETRIYWVDAQNVPFVRITAAGRDLLLPGSLGISEVKITPLRVQRYLALPVPDDRFPVDRVSLARDQDRSACVPLDTSVACLDILSAPGEDGDTLARRLTLPFADTYRVTGTVSLRRHVSGTALTPGGAVARVDADTDGVVDVARGPSAAIDGDPGTTWIPTSADDKLEITLPGLQRITHIRARLDPDAPASTPTELRVRSGSRVATVTLDDQGRGELPDWKVSSLIVQVSDSEQSVSIAGQAFVPNLPGISELTLNRQRLGDARNATTYPCGSGPDVRIGSQILETAVRASVRELMRGGSVPFGLCDFEALQLPAGKTDVLVQPSTLFRADTLTLTRTAATSATSVDLDVARDDRGAPRSVDLPARTAPSLLSLAQNDNAGWSATLNGKELESQRVNGWKQGWEVPPGEAGRVTFRYDPEPTFVAALVAGGVGLLLCLVGALVPAGRRSRRRQPQPCTDGRPGLLDAVLVLAAGGLLMAGWGVAAVGVALVAGLALRRFPAWGLLAGVAMVLVGLGLSWHPLTQATWVNEWRQGWSLAALALVVAALAARRVSSVDADGGDAEVLEADRV